MSHRRRIPWTEPRRPDVPSFRSSQALAVTIGDPWGHVVAICRARRAADAIPAVSRFDPAAERFVDGPLADLQMRELDAPLPLLLDLEDESVVADDPIAICRALSPELFPDAAHDELVVELRRSLLDAVYRLGALDDQAAYEAAHEELRRELVAVDERLSGQRYLLGSRREDLAFADVMLFAFAVRIDPVYYELFKASAFLLSDLPQLQGHARDLFELPEVWSTTDFEGIKADHYLFEPVLNPRRILPRGGIPHLDAPHDRAERFAATDDHDDGVEERQDDARGAGEWVRPPSKERHWIRPDGGRYPAQAGRYHLYAPYTCPWSHRALLARSVKGLQDVVGASVVYFRRDPERGWQFNPAIPGCTADQLHGHRYVVELYETVGSDEKSVPVLWDSETETIVSNESAEILRMFDSAFGDLATRDVALYPEAARAEIDRLNAIVYQRINNGAYKAGFANSQAAYDRAFARYFAALDWLEELLSDRRWLAGTDAPTEADLRLFPTLFRHDAVYYARFKLDLRRIADYPRLSDWLDRMLAFPGVADASNLDHARNGYFGRTGNEIVPAGPTPLGLSPSAFSRDVWLNRR